jgi:hypothetical protein
MMFCRQTLRTFIYSSEIFPWIIIITIVFLFLVIPDIALLLTLHFVLNYVWRWRTCSNWVCNLFEFRRSLQPRLPLPLHQPLAQDPSSVPSRSVALLILPVSLLLVTYACSFLTLEFALQTTASGSSRSMVTKKTDMAGGRGYYMVFVLRC